MFGLNNKESLFYGFFIIVDYKIYSIFLEKLKSSNISTFRAFAVFNNVVVVEKHKTIELRSIGSGSDKNVALYDSERKVFEILFFRGIPNTSIENPLIGSNETQLTKKHEGYFDSFFKDRYKTFIMSVSQASPPQKHRGITWVVNDIKINVLSLKRDLEEHGITRKFGF